MLYLRKWQRLYSGASIFRWENIMSDDNIQAAAARRQRVQRLKKCIILMFVTGTTVPFVMCVFLLIHVHGMNRTLDSLVNQLQLLTDIVQEQQSRIEELSAETAVIVQGNSVASESGRETEERTPETLPDKQQDAETFAEESVQEITAAHKVYLTFDDGPSTYTEDILDILDSYDIKATFFVVGKETDSAKAALQDIVARGHTLGMHSYSHKYSEIYQSVEDFAEDFTKLQDYLYEVTGVKSTVYRFPGGSSNTVSKLDMWDFADYLEEQDVRFFDWNISSGDGGKELLTVETLVSNSTADIEKYETSIILLHDSANKRTTVEALPIIIENILAMEDTVILPITDDTEPVQHIH